MIRDYLAASLLTLAVLGGCVVLILWALWGYRWLRTKVSRKRRAYREARARMELIDRLIDGRR